LILLAFRFRCDYAFRHASPLSFFDFRHADADIFFADFIFTFSSIFSPSFAIFAVISFRLSRRFFAFASRRFHFLRAFDADAFTADIF
jgi:hypothetical protein